MDSVFIIHGGFKRKSTAKWMAALKLFLEQKGFKVHLFTWSGLPFRGEIAAHSKRFTNFYRDHCTDGKNFVIAKSLGCDIVACSLNSISPQKVIYNCPAFLVTNTISKDETITTILLDKDDFINFCKHFIKFRVIESFQNQVIVEHSDLVNHHTLNNNILLTIHDKKVFLYDFYNEILNDARGNLPLR